MKIRRNIIWAVCIGALAACVGVALLLCNVHRPPTNKPDDSRLGNNLSPTKLGVAPASPSAQSNQKRGTDPAAEDLLDIHVPALTMEDLQAKGFPLISNPRKAAYTQTAPQSVEEVVRDLGNMMVIEYCSLHIGITQDPTIIGHYYRIINPNIKVLRLIEEGRRKPEAITPLLSDAINNCLADYDSAHKRYREAWKSGKWGSGTGDNDSYYEEHRTYSDPVLELGRRHDSVYMAFYVMANLDCLDPHLLAMWINKQDDRRWRCEDMNLWLIDCYFRQPGDKSDASKRHFDLLGGEAIGGKRVRQSQWNAPWDIHHPLLLAKHVDTKDIVTIEVLRIPRSLSRTIDGKMRERVLANFLAAYGNRDARP